MTDIGGPEQPGKASRLVFLAFASFAAAGAAAAAFTVWDRMAHRHRASTPVAGLPTGVEPTLDITDQAASMPPAAHR